MNPGIYPSIHFTIKCGSRLSPNSIVPFCLVLGQKVVDVKAREVPRSETTPGSVQVYPYSVVCLLRSLHSKKVFGVNKEAI